MLCIVAEFLLSDESQEVVQWQGLSKNRRGENTLP